MKSSCLVLVGLQVTGRANSGLRNTIARLAIVRLLRYWETNGVDYRVGMHLLGLGKLRK